MKKINLGAGACALVIGCLGACAAHAEEKSATELWDVFGSFGRAQGQAVKSS